VGDGSGYSRCQRESGRVYGGGVHGFAESGGDGAVRTDSERILGRGDGNHGRRGQARDSVVVRIAASAHENERRQRYEPDLTSVLCTHQPCLSLVTSL